MWSLHISLCEFYMCFSPFVGKDFLQVLRFLHNRLQNSLILQQMILTISLALRLEMSLETLSDHGTIKYPLPYKLYHLVHLLDLLKCIVQLLLYWTTLVHCSNPPVALYFHTFFLHLLGGILLPINCSLQHCTKEMYMCHSSHCQHPQKRSAAIRGPCCCCEATAWEDMSHQSYCTRVRQSKEKDVYNSHELL